MTVEVSRLEPANGPGSAVTGSPPLLASVVPAMFLADVPGCSAHWVRPDWPAISAMAFGVDGPVTV